MELTGAAAFRALSEILAGKRDAETVLMADIALERLRRAMKEGAASPLDRAVLVRQVLLGEEGRRGSGQKPRLPASGFSVSCANDVGLEIVDGQVRALPWIPSWLPDATRDPGWQAARLERRRFGPDDKGPVADPFIKRLGHSRYRSGGQRAAIRSALFAPPGSTTAIALPTGEGKSLVFQAINEIGFSFDPDVPGRDGVTLVIVPTIALAYDHERKYQEKGNEPLAYVGSSATDVRARIRDRIEHENRGLVFVAPEAACQSLRPALLAASSVGRLKAVVIDEAHLIDAWGTGFRTEFQSLSGLRRELIAASPNGREPRTVLLSATVTPETFETLRDLFTNPGELRTLSAGQLRPEPDYWVASPAIAEIRNDRIIEALYHLPRPAILYVTEVAEAKAWEQRLRELAYCRLAAFHGQTPDHIRKRTLGRWQDGDLDLVVATSAFGLGIDYPHVRTIVHACVPETLDRFYQEVGRGGRDGCASISVAIPSDRDFRTARGLNQETVLSVERGRTRWKAMFEHPDRVHLHGTTFRLRLNVAPGQSADDIDLVGERNLQWNARLLSLLSRAGLIRLGEASDPPGALSRGGEHIDPRYTDGIFETVEILESDHLNESVWQDRVEPVRQKIQASRARSLQLMLEHLHGKSCPSELLLELYGRASLDPMCSECVVCRGNVKLRKPKVLRSEPAPCWSAPPLHGLIEQWFKSGGDVVLTYDLSDEGPAFRRRWAKAFDAFWKYGLRCLAVIGDPPVVLERAIRNLQDVPVFVSYTNGMQPPQLPYGPRVIVVGSGCAVRLSSTATPSPGRLLIVSDDMRDVHRPGDAALERFSGLVFDLDSFLARLV